MFNKITAWNIVKNIETLLRFGKKLNNLPITIIPFGFGKNTELIVPTGISNIEYFLALTTPLNDSVHQTCGPITWV